jgi:MFS family permease
VVRRDELAEGNAKLALSAEVARVSGPGLAGTLVQVLSAPVALVMDAATFLISALCLARIEAREPTSQSASERRGIASEIREGAGVTTANPILRALAGASGLGNVGDGMLIGSGVAILFATRDLGLDAMALGGVMSGVGIGGLLGAAVAGPATRRWGVGVSFLAAMVLWGVSYLALAVVAGPPITAAVLMALALSLVGMVNPVAGVNAVTLRQAVTPERLRGRVTALGQVISWGGVTLGALVGGILAEQLGLRATIALAGLLPLVGFVCLWFSPVRTLREIPDAAPA